MNEWEKTKKAYYGQKTVVWTEWGAINFNPESLKKVVGGKRLSYDEYLDLQKNSNGKARHYFRLCFHTVPLGFKGQIEKCTKDRVCFKRIYVDGMYPDGACFEGKEDHVWMEREGFEKYREGDSLSFFAEVYMYLKTGDGKSLDYGLRKPEEIRRIDAYELPSEQQLKKQALEQLLCGTCNLRDVCFGDYCMLPGKTNNKKRRYRDKESMKMYDFN